MIRILLLIANSAATIFIVGSMLAYEKDTGFRHDPKGLTLGLIVIALTLANATYIWVARRRTPRWLDPQPPLAGPRPIVGWALTTFPENSLAGLEARENVLFLFRCQLTQPACEHEMRCSQGAGSIRSKRVYILTAAF